MSHSTWYIYERMKQIHPIPVTSVLQSCDWIGEKYDILGNNGSLASLVTREIPVSMAVNFSCTARDTGIVQRKEAEQILVIDKFVQIYCYIEWEWHHNVLY